MKVKLFTLLTALALFVSLAGVQPVQAVGYGTQFITSVTYLNVGTDVAHVTIDFYPEANSAKIPISLPDLPKGAGTSLYMGSVSQVTSGFRGSAILSSSQPLVSTLVQLPSASSGIKNRPLSNGFSGGAPYVLIPTALKAFFSTNSIFSVQNVDTVGADLRVVFVPADGSAPVTKTVTNLPAGAAQYYDLGKMTDFTTFNGSVQIFAKKTGTTTDGAVVATALELSLINNNIYAFEGTPSDSNVVYMPSAFCNWSSSNTNSSYAVQNTSTSANASVTVNYSSGKSDGPYTILPGQKKSFPGCGVTAGVNAAGFIGSAVINSTGAKIVAVGKVFGGNISTAFLGFAAGSTKMALPYVRWTEANWLNGTRQRVNIAIQNVGTAPLAAGTVKVTYFDKDGNQVGNVVTNSASLPVGGKFSSSAIDAGPAAAEFGYYGTQIGGGAVVEGPTGSSLAVIGRVQTFIAGGFVAEDYNGIPIP